MSDMSYTCHGIVNISTNCAQCSCILKKHVEQIIVQKPVSLRLNESPYLCIVGRTVLCKRQSLNGTLCVLSWCVFFEGDAFPLGACVMCGS
jgi:hypothetical protein